MHIPEALQVFKDYLVFEKRFSAHTSTAYLQDLEQLAQYLQHDFGVTAVAEVSPAMVRSWLASLRDAEMQPRTINRKLSAAKSLFKFLLKNGRVDKSPVAQLSGPKAGKRLPVYVEQDKLEVLWKEDVFPDTPEGQTERLVVLLLYHTGMRRSELTQLTPQHIDFYTQSIKILGKGSKERIIPVADALLHALRTRLAERTDPMDSPLLTQPNGRPMQPHHIYSIVKKYLSLVTTQPKKSPHVLRHSFATHLTNAGADLNAVKELLGHASLAATQVYTHNTIEKLKRVHGTAHPKG